MRSDGGASFHNGRGSILEREIGEIEKERDDWQERERMGKEERDEEIEDWAEGHLARALTDKNGEAALIGREVMWERDFPLSSAD